MTMHSAVVTYDLRTWRSLPSSSSAASKTSWISPVLCALSYMPPKPPISSCFNSCSTSRNAALAKGPAACGRRAPPSSWPCFASLWSGRAARRAAPVFPPHRSSPPLPAASVRPCPGSRSLPRCPNGDGVLSATSEAPRTNSSFQTAVHRLRPTDPRCSPLKTVS